MALKGSGESFAQISAEKANPRLDLWFGGTGDPHLQAAELGPARRVQVAAARAIAAMGAKAGGAAKYRTVGLYLGVLGIGYNTELLAKQEARRARVLAGPRQARVRGRGADGESERLGHRVHGDRHAGAGVRRGRGFQVPPGAAQEHQHATRARATAPIKAVARGETIASISFMHDVVTEAQAGFPVKGVAPCEGTGYEIGSMSIVKGARNLDNAKKFYDWALTPKAQALAAQAKQYQIPSNVAHPGVAAIAEDGGHQAHRLRLREVRPVRRAQAPARALGPGRRRRREVNPGLQGTFQ